MSSNDLATYHMQEAINLIERLLPLDKWNFRQSIRFFADRTHPIVIYNSEKCRIKALYEASSRYADHKITVHYGRLEVADNADSLRWKFRENYHLYWHSVSFPLQFLDGLSPRQAIVEKEPRLIKEFEQSELAKEIKYEPEKILIMHAKIWDTYGQQIFDIFDVRNTSLWEQYSAFVREFWEALSRP